MNLDAVIFKAIKGSTPDAPQSLVGILAFVDAGEKLVLSYEELIGGLERLVERGQITQVAPDQFCETHAPASPRVMSLISRRDYERACMAYHKLAKQAMRQTSTTNDFTREKMVIRWAIADDQYASKQDENDVESLAKLIAAALEPNNFAEVNGFQFGRGHIDILIFGKATDDDTDAIYSVIVPIFKAFGCPPGSYLVREYSDYRSDLVSDRVDD